MMTWWCRGARRQSFRDELYRRREKTGVVPQLRLSHPSKSARRGAPTVGKSEEKLGPLLELVGLRAGFVHDVERRFRRAAETAESG